MHDRRIARGARFLDRKDPLWFTKVDPHSLDPNSQRMCVIGQVFGDFQEFLYRRFVLPDRFSEKKRHFLIPWWPAGLVWVATHGFGTLRETDSEWRAAWAEEIATRRARRNAPLDRRLGYTGAAEKINH